MGGERTRGEGRGGDEREEEGKVHVRGMLGMKW